MLAAHDVSAAPKHFHLGDYTNALVIKIQPVAGTKRRCAPLSCIEPKVISV
jgi:hypothetical protein